MTKFLTSVWGWSRIQRRHQKSKEMLQKLRAIFLFSLATLQALILTSCIRTASIEIQNNSGGVVNLVIEKVEEGTQESFQLKNYGSKVFEMKTVPNARGPEVKISGSGDFKVPFVTSIILTASPGHPQDTLKIKGDIQNVSYVVMLSNTNDFIDRVRFTFTNSTYGSFISNISNTTWTNSFVLSNVFPILKVEAYAISNASPICTMISVNGYIESSNWGVGSNSSSYNSDYGNYYSY